jgi:four helix bundle protein
MTTTLRQLLLEQSITIIGQAQPLIEAIGRKDRELESQLRRSLGSIALNVAEGFGAHAGHARLRFRTALGSLYESQAALQVAAAWGYVEQQAVNRIVAALEAFGGRLYGLSRR